MPTPSPDRQDAPVIDELLRDLSDQEQLSMAVLAAETAVHWLHRYRAEQCSQIWSAACHLIKNRSTRCHKAGTTLLKAVTSRQDISIQSRQTIFDTISDPMPPDVLPEVVSAFISLTDFGKNLDFTERSVFPIITHWIVPVYEVIASARSKFRRPQRHNGTGIDETVLGNLFEIIVDLITRGRDSPAPQDLEALLRELFMICKRTSVANDIKSALAVFDAIICNLEIPDTSFGELLEVLCSIQASVKSLTGPTSRTVRSLARSQKKQQMVDALYSSILCTGEQERNISIVRGGVDILSDLVSAQGQDRMPEIEFYPLIESLDAAAKRDDGRLNIGIMETCLNTIQAQYLEISLKQSWRGLVNVLLASCARAIETPVLQMTEPLSPQKSKTNTSDDVRASISAVISRVMGAMEAAWPRLSQSQRLDVCHFFMEAHQNLSPSQSELLLDFCNTEKVCFPGYSDWSRHCWNLLNHFVITTDKATDVRIDALNTLNQVFSTENTSSLYDIEGIAAHLIDFLGKERSYQFFDALITFLVDISERCSRQIFLRLVTTLSGPMEADADRSKQSLPISSQQNRMSSSSLEPSMSNVTTNGLVRIFLRSLDTAPNKAVDVFERLIDIARSPEHPVDSRLSALKLLFRLRCDSDGFLYVISTTESDFLVTVLYHTEDSPSKNSGSEELEAKIETKSLPLSSSRTSSLAPITKWIPPVWASSDAAALPESPSAFTTRTCAFLREFSNRESNSERVALKINLWLEAIIGLLQQEKEWDIFSYVLAHLGPQLMNRHLFQYAIPQIQLLRSVLCERIKNESFLEAFSSLGVKKSDVAMCIFDSLTMLICFHQYFARSEQDEIVKSFMTGIGTWEATSRGCIHALSVCCHEMPFSVTRAIGAIIVKMSKIITQPQLASHILEFLAVLSRIPDVYNNLQEYLPIFGICIRFLQSSRERRLKAVNEAAARANASTSYARNSGGMKETATLSVNSVENANSANETLSKYIYSLTYHVMIYWFLSLKLRDRRHHVPWIIKRLIFEDGNGEDGVEEQSRVLIDMMERVTYSDLGDTIPLESFPPEDGPVIRKSWIVGMSILTVETAISSGLSQIIKRQASGTTYSIYQQRTAPMLPHQVPVDPTPPSLMEDTSQVQVFPSHILLQMTTTAIHMPQIVQPIPLPDDEPTRRALRMFDRNDIVDGHKIGVIYVDYEQTSEADILANTKGSADYDHFLSRLGTRVPLRDAKFNTQGLHCELDGEHTYAWRDRTIEIVYHVTTMMPTNLETDPQCVNKKRHVGNDSVNIIFNRSNKPFHFDTIPSQFNAVNIVISPISRISNSEAKAIDEALDFDQWFYIVKVLSRPDFPDISAAANPKIISGRSLAAFVRLIALNASFYCSVFNSDGGEHISSWQNRFREIRRLRERAYGLAMPPEQPEASQVDDVFRGFDFSRWG